MDLDHAALHEMSGLDAAFLYLETPNAPMHVGGLSILEGSLTFDAFRQLLAVQAQPVGAGRGQPLDHVDIAHR